MVDHNAHCLPLTQYVEDTLPIRLLCLVESTQVVNKQFEDRIRQLYHSSIHDRSALRVTHQTLYELLQSILAAPFLLILLVFRVVAYVFVCELVDNLHHIDYNIHVFMAEQADEPFDGPGTDDLGVSEHWRLREGKQSFQSEVEVRFRVDEPSIEKQKRLQEERVRDIHYSLCGVIRVLGPLILVLV